MKHKLAGLVLLAGLGMFTAAPAVSQVSFGVRIGPPPTPRVVRVRPVSPGSGYAWVEGYWYPVKNRYRWHEGYWTRPPYEGANWVGPRYEGNQFIDGRWEGNRGEFMHDHKWDRDRKNRDYGRRDARDRR